MSDDISPPAADTGGSHGHHQDHGVRHDDPPASASPFTPPDSAPAGRAAPRTTARTAPRRTPVDQRVDQRDIRRQELAEELRRLDQEDAADGVNRVRPDKRLRLADGSVVDVAGAVPTHYDAGDGLRRVIDCEPITTDD